MRKVSSSSKIRLKTAGSSTRSSAPQANKIVRKKENPNWGQGKTPGNGLDNYNLDLMVLE